MKRILLSILIVLLYATSSFAALAATTVWEVRQTATANNVNGGGYNAANATPGTDRSLTDAAYKDHNDLVVADGDANPAVVTSAAHPFTADDNGNLIHITAGTNMTAGWYEVVSVDGSGNATLDRATGATDGQLTGGTYYLGGAMSLSGTGADTWGEIIEDGNIVYVKYDASNPTITMGDQFSASTTASLTLPVYFVGYDSTRTKINEDANRETIACGASYNFFTGAYWVLRNLIFTGAYDSVVRLGQYNRCERLKVTNSSATANRDGIYAASNYAIVTNCEAISTAGYAVRYGANYIKIIGCYLHDSKYGIYVGIGYGVITNNIIESNTTAAIYLAATYDFTNILHNTMYGVNSGDTGILGDDNEFTTILGNTISNFATAAVSFSAACEFNFSNWNNYYSSTTTTNLTKGAHDLNVDPGFTDAAGGNFTPGTNLKGLNIPGTYGSSSSVSYLDIGAVQRVEPAAGGSAYGF